MRSWPIAAHSTRVEDRQSCLSLTHYRTGGIACPPLSYIGRIFDPSLGIVGYILTP